MILQTLVSTILGYVNAPARKFLFGYALLAMLFIFTFPYWEQSDCYENLCIGAFFVPGFSSLYVVKLLDIANNFQDAIAAAAGVLVIFELPFVYACYRLGRCFGNRTGNIHIF